MNAELIAKELVDAAVGIHRELGNGLIESAYELVLAHEMRERGFAVECQKPMHVIYKGLDLGVAYRLDLLIDSTVVVELKAVDALHPVHEAQLLSYLKLGGYELGFLMNFHAVLMKDGTKRMVNNYGRRNA